MHLRSACIVLSLPLCACHGMYVHDSERAAVASAAKSNIDSVDVASIVKTEQENLAKILNVNEDAHIISTKQVGSYSVNEPILRALNEDIRNGKNIEWIPIWQQITASVKNDPTASELMKDYVPPHKNLGAIFIKAYRKATGEM